MLYKKDYLVYNVVERVGLVFMVLSDLLNLMLIVGYFMIAIILFFIILLKVNGKNYKLINFFLIVYQLICGIAIVIGYEKCNSFMWELLLLSSLILNTVSLVVFNIRYNKKRKELNYKLSIISILAIICGVIFSANYIIVFSNHLEIGYDTSVREILYSDMYTKEEAEELLENIYSALQRDKYSDGCLKLYGFWEDRENDNTFYINLHDTCRSAYLPPNAMKLEVNDRDNTKIEKIYWQFNDNIQIPYYEYKRQVDDFAYIYNSSLYKDEPMPEIKANFEDAVKSKLKSPSTAIFTYKNFRYNEIENRFLFTGWVESQNSFGAMVRTDFTLNLKPCKKESTNKNCEYYGLDYSWDFDD